MAGKPGPCPVATRLKSRTVDRVPCTLGAHRVGANKGPVPGS